MGLKRKQRKLQKYVRKYFAKHPEVRLVVVAGSIGKTYAKTSIATVLSQRYRVRLFHGNRGTNFTAPLAILGIDYPGDIQGWKAWHAVFRAARKRIKDPTDVDIIIHEVNASHVGAMAEYATYLAPHVAVVTAVSASNLEVFDTVGAIAQEQLTAANISQLALINRDDIDGTYATYLTNPQMNTFGTGGAAEYRFAEEDYSVAHGYKGLFIAPEWAEPVPVTIAAHDELSVRLAVGAAAVGVKMGLDADAIAAGLAAVPASPGRMRVLRGVEDSVLLDDTSNNSPLGSTVALRALYQIAAPQRVAVFGSMKRLGSQSAAEHQALGMLCDPSQLAWVVTVGEDANTYLAQAARSRGCQVKSFQTALEAGAFVHSVIEQGSAVLFNGPEDGVYLEEAVKVVLHSADDEVLLVRQSPDWAAKKTELFSQFA